MTNYGDLKLAGAYSIAEARATCDNLIAKATKWSGSEQRLSAWRSLAAAAAGLGGAAKSARSRQWAYPSAWQVRFALTDAREQSREDLAAAIAVIAEALVIDLRQTFGNNNRDSEASEIAYLGSEARKLAGAAT